jgi:tRNA dimethylallyltransferase
MGKYLIAIAGATASGKTSLAIALARRFDAEIFSCDARQFYKEMAIGTAKPTAEELAAAPHHFVNNLSINDIYTVKDYEAEVLAALDLYFKEKDIAILVGGSGLFYRAVCEGSLDEIPSISDEIRQYWGDVFEQKGIAALQAAVADCDPVFYAKADIQNPRRLLRALEVHSQTGRPFSDFHQQNNEKAALTHQNAPQNSENLQQNRPFTCLKIGLDWPRDLLYARINQRVENMFSQGLLAEAEALYPHKNLQPLQTVGYREIFDFMDGRLPDLATAKEKIKQNSRHYAKRQGTWFAKEPRLHCFSPPHDSQNIGDYVQNRIEIIRQEEE